MVYRYTSILAPEWRPRAWSSRDLADIRCRSLTEWRVSQLYRWARGCASIDGDECRNFDEEIRPIRSDTATVAPTAPPRQCRAHLGVGYLLVGPCVYGIAAKASTCTRRSGPANC